MLYYESKNSYSKETSGGALLNPDLLSIRFSTPSLFTAWGRSFNSSDAEQSCHESWRPAKHPAGFIPTWSQLLLAAAGPGMSRYPHMTDKEAEAEG